MLFVPSGKGRKRQKKGEKGRFRPISGKGGQTPLKPPFVKPPFAAPRETLWEKEYFLDRESQSCCPSSLSGPGSNQGPKRTHKAEKSSEQHQSGKSKGGLSKGGLGPKGANWAKKGPFGAISALPPWVWGAEELVPISPEKAPTGPEKAPISPEKARFPRKDFPPIFSENLGLKPPFVSPRLDFPKPKQISEQCEDTTAYDCPAKEGSAGRIHHVMWSFSARKRQKLFLYMTSGKQALCASCDVIISGQICGSNVQRFFTLGDGCWLKEGF